MNFEAILKYQDTDRELYKIENELKASKEMKDVSIAKMAISETTENIRRINAESGEVYKQYDKVLAELKAVDASVAEMEQIALNVNDIGEMEYYEKKMSELTDKTDSLKRDFDRLAAKLDQTKAAYEKLMLQGKQFNERFAKATNALNELKKAMGASAAPIIAELNRLKPLIDPKMLSAYESRRANKKLPAFVAYDKENQSCVCGMNLPSDCTGKLKTKGDFAECPNCTRILYVEE